MRAQAAGASLLRPGLGAEVLVPPRDTPTGRVIALSDPQQAVVTVLQPAA